MKNKYYKQTKVTNLKFNLKTTLNYSQAATNPYANV